MSNNLFTTTLPPINNLFGFRVFLEKREVIKISAYNATIIKCRQLICENKEIIAYPSLADSYYIVVICKEKYFCEGYLRFTLKKYNLSLTYGPLSVERADLERCLHYTISMKIAPKWNTIQNYLIQGRDFLINDSTVNGTSLHIRAQNNGEVSFIFYTGRIKLPTMSLNTLDLNSEQLRNLSKNNFTTIKEYEAKTVRVLPSLKKGKIISISKKLQGACLKMFPEYKYMRRFWKNTYGYRLPENDDKSMMYLEIKFFDGFPNFTYPLPCVRPYVPIFHKTASSLEVMNDFIRDMISSCPIILGENYKMAVLMNSSANFVSCTQLLNKTPHNHFNAKTIISDTQNSAVGVLETQNINNDENIILISDESDDETKFESNMAFLVRLACSLSPEKQQNDDNKENNSNFKETMVKKRRLD